MNYVIARFKHENDEYNYRIYVTDSLRHITKINVRYYDWISQPNKKAETRTAEQVVADVIKNAGLIVVENGGEG